MDALDRELAGLLAANPAATVPTYSAQEAANLTGARLEAFQKFFRKETLPEFPATLNRHKQHEGVDASEFEAQFESYERNRAYTNYDAQFNIGAYRKGQLIASIGWYPNPQTAVVSQIQGKPRLAGALNGYRWEDALLEEVVTWANTAQIPRVIVRSARNILWTQARGHLSMERAVKRYDLPAQRLGAIVLENGDYLLPSRSRLQ
jgi:hypothetical protein